MGAGHSSALPQEGGDKNACVQIECGMPPAGREVQDLRRGAQGKQGTGKGGTCLHCCRLGAIVF